MIEDYITQENGDGQWLIFAGWGVFILLYIILVCPCSPG